MKWSLLIPLTALILYCGLSCDKDHKIVDSAVSVSGTVTDSLSGLPIEGAMIRWPDTIRTIPDPFFTDSAGKYSFPLWGGYTTVYVQKDGYYTKWKELVNITADINDCDFQLVPE